MLINWYTVIFQGINFLVLVFLLRRFLYRPIIKAMDEREQAITRRQEEAAEKIAAAEAEAGAYREKTAELREREAELLEQARIEAAAERRKLGEGARREMAELQKRWQEAFFRQKEAFVIELRRQMGRQACQIARKCLRDLAGAELEEMAWNVFMEKVEKLQPEELEKLKALLARGEEKIFVRSAFALPGEKLEQLKERLAALLPGEPPLYYETAPGLICGLELEARGYRIAWTIESYMEGLEEQILKTLEQAKEAVDNG